MSSSRTAERLARLLAMVPWVIAHPGARVNEVCRRFGYDREDLVRDLNLLFVCGLPGYGPGDLMEAYLDDDEVVIDMADYFARPVNLTAVEALMMLAGGMAILSSGTADPALESAVGKLTAVLLPEEGIVDVDLGAEPGPVGLLRTAAAAGDVVRIEYVAIASGETTVRDIEPWRVFAALGNWYLTGYCRLARGERIFRVDRIRTATPTGDHFSPPQDLPPAGVRYAPGVDDTVVRIALDATARWVTDYYPVREVSRDAAGTVVEFSASDPAVIARLLLRLGGAAQLLAGGDAAEVRSCIDDLRSRVLARYR